MHAPRTLSTRDRARTRARAAVPLLWVVVLVAIVMGPMARRGWVVTLDWVVGPRLSFARRILDGAALPAGPLFYAVATVLQGLAGAAVGWLVPALALVVAGIGGARLAAVTAPPTPSLAPLPSLAAQLCGATALVWNPYVHERLYAGQVAVLAGYALLPWLVVSTVAGLRTAGPGRLARAVAPTAALWIAAAALSLHFAVLGGLVVVAIVVTEPGRPSAPPRLRLAWLMAAAGATVAVTLLWLVPIVGDAPPLGSDATVRAFATRPDPSLGLLGGAAVQVGFWRSSPAQPGSSGGAWWPLAAGMLGGAVVVGLAAGAALPWRRRTGRGVGTRPAPGCRGVLAAGLLGWLVGTGPTGPIGGLIVAAARLPGLGVMRESGKFLALVSVAWAVGLARFAGDAVRLPRRRTVGVAGVALTAAFAVAPAVLTPGLAGAVGGRLAAVRFPSAWAPLVSAVDARPGGCVAVVPFVAYTDPGMTNGRLTRTLAAALFGKRALVSDDARFPGLAPSATTRAVTAAFARPAGARGAALARVDVRFVAAGLPVGTISSPSADELRHDPDLAVVAERDGLVLYENRRWTPRPA